MFYIKNIQSIKYDYLFYYPKKRNKLEIIN